MAEISTTRRGFITAGAAAFAFAGLPGGARADGAAAADAAASATGKRIDPNAVAFISDLHVGLPLAEQKYKTMRDYPHQPAASAATVREILALPVLPATVICLGDISLAFAEPDDYRVAAELLKPLHDAGLKVVHAMGNHDIRSVFLENYAGADAATEVPDRLVSDVRTPFADFLVLDSLVEPKKRGDYGACTKKGLGDAQSKWLRERVASATKPLFVCAHHPPHGLGIPTEIPHNPLVAAWIHGHTHCWSTALMRGGLDDNARMLRVMGLPTAGFEMDVGWALMRLSPGRAALECHARDYYYPLPRQPRPAQWDCFVADWNGRTINFALR